MKHMKFFDLQTGRYAHSNDLDGMVEMLLSQMCECSTHTYKDGKCYACYVVEKIEEIEEISEEEKRRIVESFEYQIEES